MFPSLPGRLPQKLKWQGLEGPPVTIPYNVEGVEGIKLMLIPSIPSPPNPGHR